MNKHDVIVVGAGPVGLISALILADSGLAVLVLEKRDQLNQVSKASTFHSPSLAILSKVGIYQEFEKQAIHVGKQQFRTPEGIIGELNFDLLKDTTPFPFRKHLEQSLLTQMLLDKLSKYKNFNIEFKTEFIKVAENATDKVVVEVSGIDTGIDQYQCQYLIGADGAHSAVRKSLDISTESKQYAGHVVRVRTDDSLLDYLPGLGPISYLAKNPYSISFLKMPDCWRVILRAEQGVSEEESLSDEWILARMESLIPGMTHLPTVIGKDIYKPSMQIAETNKVGNVILCGDAVHLTNTRGGMNMNAGIHDAYEVSSAVIQSLRNNQPDSVSQAASHRLKVAKEVLIPRSDTLVSNVDEWMDKVRSMFHDTALARDYLVRSSMLDMVTL